MHEVQLPPIRPSRHVSPTTVDEALNLLATHRDQARVVAGGTDLMIELDRRVGDDVAVLVDITRIEGLDRIEQRDGRIHLGPLVTHNQCTTSETIVDLALPLAQAALEVGSPALRNRATVVGNVVTASPANDTISALAVLDAELTLRSTRGERTVALADFHTGVRGTVLAPDELVTGISIAPLGGADRGLYLKLGLRRAQAISVVHLAVVCSVDARGGEVSAARLALGSVAPTIVRVPAAEEALVGRRLTDNAIATAAHLAAEAVQPIGDIRAPADYRTELIPVMVTRALRTIAAGEHRSTYPTRPPTLGGPCIHGDGLGGELGEGDSIETTVNGQLLQAPWTATSLLDWLRLQGLTGTKEGCAEGECGACTIHLDGAAVLSCLVPSGRAAGAHITTIEGLANDGRLHPVQQAFIDNAAVQCGYCIPGFIMAGASLHDEIGQPSGEQIALGMAGNLCRCTGYYTIEDAVEAVGSANADVAGTVDP